jgi:hypothetical protein
VIRRRTATLAAAFLTAASFGLATASSASAGTGPSVDSTVFALGPSDNYVAEWMGLSQGWIVIGGPASNLYVGSAGVFAIDPTSGDIEQYNGTPGSWTVIGGPGESFAEGNGHLYGLGPNGAYVAEWMGLSQGWTVIGGPTDAIYAGTAGLVETKTYTVTTGTLTTYDQTISRYNGTPGSWSYIGWSGNGSQQLAVGYTIYKIDGGGRSVSEWAGGTTWGTILDNAGYLNSLVGGDAGLTVNEDAGGIFLYQGSLDHWLKVSDFPYPQVGTQNPVAVSRTGIYGVGYTYGVGVTSVDLYSGSGSTWTTIGGPADIVAAGD